MSTETLREALNRANPNDAWDRARLLELGELLSGHLPQHLRRKDPAASAYVDSTLLSVALPGASKACAILRATSIVGGVTGELVVKLFGVTPGSGEIAVAPNGDIVTLAADAITSLDVSYVPERGEEVEIEIPVDPATGFLEIPQRYVDRGVILLTEAEITEGTLAQKMEILMPASSAPATTNARLSLQKSRVHFAVADAATKARVRFLLAPSTANDLATALHTVATF